MVADKMVPTKWYGQNPKWYTDKMVLDKMVYMDEMVRTNWHNFIFFVHFNSVEFNIYLVTKSQINDKHTGKAKGVKVEAGLMKNIIFSMGAGLIDDFIRNILAIPLCPYHFVHTILSNTILSVYHFVHTILSVPFCPLPFCPRTYRTCRDAGVDSG